MRETEAAALPARRPATAFRGMLPALARRSTTQARYVLLGCIGLLTGLQIVIVGQASALEEAHAFSRMAELVPGFLQRGLGNKSLLLATFKGTVALGYFHPVVLVVISILAIYFATEPAHEVESGLVDLVLARPVPRHAVITRSAALAAAAAIGAATMMFVGTQLGLRLFADPRFSAPSASTLVWLLVHLVAVALACAAFALAVAAGARRWTTAFTTAALVVIALYLLDFLAIGWPPLRPLAWLSPFHYYPALSIVAGDSVDWSGIATLASATAIFTAIAYRRFSRRDL